jgi:hypothetical protein
MTALQPTLFGVDASEPATGSTTRNQKSEVERRSLDAIIQTAKVDSAKKRDGGAVGAVIARLAQAPGGFVTVADLRAEGFPDQAIADTVQTDSTDRRSKPRAKLGIVGGIAGLWLTTTGWTAAGFPSRRELSPSAESIEHAEAPRRVEAWLDAVTAPYPISVDVVTGQPTRDFGERVKSLSWARLQSVGDTTGTVGVLVGGIYPDALVVERWADSSYYVGAWGKNPDHPYDAAEQVCALEIERAVKGEPLKWKVEKWAAALALGACHAVVWVVQSATVAERLAELGVGREPGQFLVPACAVGLDGDHMPHLLTPPDRWWPLRLPAAGSPR